MNWYKIAQLELGFVSYRKYNEFDTEFKINLNEKEYTYYGVNEYDARTIKWMINNPKIPAGVILKKLKPYSDTKLHDRLNPLPKETSQEKEEIINELIDEGKLSP